MMFFLVSAVVVVAAVFTCQRERESERERYPVVLQNLK